jgi:membrane-associated phospholipid phosphatase
VESGGIKFMFILRLLVVSLVLAWSAGILTKIFFFKDRPLPLKSDKWWKKINAGTFPSLHTIVVTISAMTVFWGVIYFEFPQYLFLIYIFIAFSVALSRIELKKHYPTDVLFGFVYAVVASFITLYLILPSITERFDFILLHGF